MFSEHTKRTSPVAVNVFQRTQERTVRESRFCEFQHFWLQQMFRLTPEDKARLEAWRQYDRDRVEMYLEALDEIDLVAWEQVRLDVCYPRKQT